MSTRTIIWDFDGTLVLHEGLWSGTMMVALNELVEHNDVSIDSIKPFLSSGFPWHESHIAHPELSAYGAWWNRMEEYLKTVFEKLGFDEQKALLLAKRTHELYIDEKRYKVFPNTIETLNKLRSLGWKNVILSNHVPELPDIVNKLGFSNVIEECFTSAVLGYEKPNIMAFRYVLDFLKQPEYCVMVGDSITADIKGATDAGITTILLHTTPPDRTFNYCKTIDEIGDMLNHILEC